MAKNKHPTNWSEVPVILDIPYVSVLLGVNPETVRRTLFRGDLKGTKVGREWRINKADVMEFVGAKEVTSCQ